MIETVFVAKTIAELLGISIGLIQGGREILKLVSAARDSAVGYVYVVQEVDYSKRFKIGRTVGSFDWLTHLGTKIPGKLEPILIIPTGDTLTIEQELHRLYATNRTDGEWFDLTQSQVTELRQLQVIVDLAAGIEINPSLELDPDAFEEAKRLFELLSNVSAGTELRQETVSTQDPSPDLDLKSVPLSNYRSLHALKRRSGYLVVVKDIEKNIFKIESTAEVAHYIDKALGLVSLKFGLELVLALESSSIKDVENNMLVLYPPNNESGWLRLSLAQLQEIRNLGSPNSIHGSLYLTPKKHWGLNALCSHTYIDCPRHEDPAGYVCIVQGVKPGNKYKIWHTRHPKKLGGDFRLALMLNNPHVAKTSRNPIKFSCIIKADQAKSFQTFLKERYAAHRKIGDWFELDDAQLQEINSLGK